MRLQAKAQMDKQQTQCPQGRTKLSIDTGFGLALLVLLALLIFYAYVFSPYQVDELTAAGKLQPPSWQHPLGTDHLSRDLLVRLGQGASSTVLVALGTVALGASLGIIFGLVGAYYGGLLDWLLARLNASLLAFPAVLMALLLVSVLGRGILQLILALGLAFVPSFARLAHSGLLQWRTHNFVLRLEVMGAPPSRLIFVHLFPLLKEQLLNALAIGLANAILAESSMSYLGFGVQPPQPSWGSMLSEAQAYVFQAPWLAIFPGAAITILVLALFLLSRRSAATPALAQQ